MRPSNNNEKRCIKCKELKPISEFSRPSYKHFCEDCWRYGFNQDLVRFELSFDFRYFYKMYPDALPETEMREYFNNRSPSPIDFESVLNNIENEISSYQRLKESRISADDLEGALEVKQVIEKLEQRREEVNQDSLQYSAQIVQQNIPGGVDR